jgi:hypothetical protein
MTRALIVAMFVLAAAPAAAATSNTSIARLGETVRLGALRVTPVSIVEDSRCPRLVTCVWRGRLRICALVRGTGQVTLDNGVPVPVASGRLTLVDAVPLSQHGELPPRGAYRFRLRFER